MSESPRSRWRLPRSALLLLSAGAAIAPVMQAVPAGTAQEHTVTIENMRYVPETLTVKRGDRVVWVNKDLFPHTASAKTFDSGSIAPGDSWTYVATAPGTYAYACTFHPTMKGEVNIQ